MSGGRTRMTAALAVLAGTLLLAVLGPHLAPEAVDRPVGAPWTPPGPFPLGTDNLGRDVWSRLLAGGGGVLAAVPIGVGATLLGAVVGLLALRHPRLGRILTAVTAAALAIPATVVVLAVAVRLPAWAAVTAAMLVLGVPLSARIIHAAAARLSRSAFVEAAELRGESPWSITVGELLPAVRGTVVADAGVRCIAALQLIVALHVLGFGPPPPAPDWALMIRENLPGARLSWVSVAAPAAAIAGFAAIVTLCLDAVAARWVPAGMARRGRRARRESRGPDVSAPASVLALRDVAVERGGRALVRVDDLRIGPGEVVGIVGASGSGKSTLLRAVAGVDEPGVAVSGDLRFLGRAWPDSAGARRRLRRARVGMLAQDPAGTLDARMPVAAVIADGRRRTTEPVPGLRSVGLPPEWAGRPAGALSGGEAARVALLRALANAPDLLVLDEPTAALDAESAARVAAAVRGHADGGGAVLVAAHDRAWLSGVCDRLLAVDAGRLGPAPSAPVSAGPADRPVRSGRALLRLDGIVIPSYGDGRALLDGVDLELRAGTITAVLGPSGAGKSTLLRAIAGLHPVAGGAILLDGAPLPTAAAAGRPARRSAAQRAAVQLVAQDSALALNPNRRLGAQVGRPARVLRGMGRAAARSEARGAFDAVGLDGGFAARFPWQVSGGQRQRAALARALVARPRVLLADEPTSALDPAAADAVMALLAALAAEGRAVLVITHEPDVAARADECFTLTASRTLAAIG